MAGGADDDGLLIFGAQFRDAQRGVVETEINHDIGLADDGAEIIALIHRADDFEFGNARGASQERLAHAAFGCR